MGLLFELWKTSGGWEIVNCIVGGEFLPNLCSLLFPEPAGFLPLCFGATGG